MSPAHRIDLDGIDGSNPLAFLASLGTLRTLDGALGEGVARLGWSRRLSAWRPRITTADHITTAALVELLHDSLSGEESSPRFDLGQAQDNLSVAPDVFRQFAGNAAAIAAPGSRLEADFALAFGSESAIDRRGTSERIRDTALRTMSGSGHQHFLGNMRNIIASTRLEHLAKALLEEWHYDDPMQGTSMRWEPTEDRRHAYQWADPTDTSQRRTGSMLGANRLAIEALPFFPTVPVNRPGGSTDVETVGFRRSRGGAIEWSWPVWEPPLPSFVIRSLLALDELQHDAPRPSVLHPRGVTIVFRSTRISVDYFRNFTPATAV